MKNIILIGFMGSGKTAAGKLIAKKLIIGFIDMDLLIEKITRMKISDIFRRHGEKHFRRIEGGMLSALSHLSNIVLSTGGGIVKNPWNRGIMRRMGNVIYLDATPEAILKRMKKTEIKKRPLLAGSKDLVKTIADILKPRLKLYRSCSHRVIETSGKTLKQVAKEAIRCARK